MFGVVILNVVAPAKVSIFADVYDASLPGCLEKGWSLKAGLHYGDYISKLVCFETQQNIFYVKKDLGYVHRFERIQLDTTWDLPA